MMVPFSHGTADTGLTTFTSTGGNGCSQWIASGLPDKQPVVCGRRRQLISGLLSGTLLWQEIWQPCSSRMVTSSHGALCYYRRSDSLVHHAWWHPHMMYIESLWSLSDRSRVEWHPDSNPSTLDTPPQHGGEHACNQQAHGRTTFIKPFSAEIFVYKPGDQRVFSILNHHKCPSWLFLLYFNTYVIRSL